MDKTPKYYIVEAAALPEVFLKVETANRMLDSGEAATVGEATKATGISRSAFYKYRDAMMPFQNLMAGHIITFQLMLKDRTGVLSGILSIFSYNGANILTINQNIPTNGCAIVTISVETRRTSTVLWRICSSAWAIWMVCSRLRSWQAERSSDMAKVAILGLGTVGSGVAKVLTKNADSIAPKAGEPVEIKYILGRHDYPDSPFRDLVVQELSVIENDPEIVVAECIGGAGTARDDTLRALKAGKSVVTSNKEVVAECGDEFFAIAQEKNLNYLWRPWAAVFPLISAR